MRQQFYLRHALAFMTVFAILAGWIRAIVHTDEPSRSLVALLGVWFIFVLAALWLFEIWPWQRSGHKS